MQGFFIRWRSVVGLVVFSIGADLQEWGIFIFSSFLMKVVQFLIYFIYSQQQWYQIAKNQQQFKQYLHKYNSMAELYDLLKQKSRYYDKNNFESQEQYDQAVRVSTTVYVGNLAYDAAQDSIKQLFGRVGKVKRVIMGINNQGQRCGFCFVIFQKHAQAERAVDYISQTKLGQKIIRVDLDPGYKQGREKGRGRDGNQKRDDFRKYQHSGNHEEGGYKKFNNSERYDRRNNDRSFGRDRYQRNRDYRQHDEDERQSGAPRKMERKEFERKERNDRDDN